MLWRKEVDHVSVDSSKKPLKPVKRKRLEPSGEVPTPKRIVECDDHIKTLLKEKADLIESKRKAALERRRQSLQRSNK